MQPTVMPAWKLTADSIWNSFRNSGKKHLLLTGTRGIGKSTLLKKLVPQGLPGLTTWAVPGQGVYLAENGTNHQAAIGIFDAQSNPLMKTVPEGFLQLGIPALRHCQTGDGLWVSIDEIGFLETGCAEYRTALLDLFEKKQVIAVVRKQNTPFLTSLLSREDAFVIDLDAPFGNTGCVIMASGLGQRFGSNKLMADFRGEPLIARALAATECIPYRVVVTRHDDVAAYCRERNIPVVLHALPYRSDTVRLGLEALPDVARCFFCPGDQPLLRSETVMSLALLAAAQPHRILRPVADDQPGAPILFPRSFFLELLSLPQGKGGGFVAKKYPEKVSFLPIQNAYELMDVDTPEALNTLLTK